MKMTTEEAFIKVLQMHGIEHAFGIIGSAMMPISDLFPEAGITFWDCAHETSGGMIADGYTRATGKMSMAIAQNGPGITNFVTPIKTAYWNHTPLLLVTPQAANKTIGQGGFQEIEQMKLFAFDVHRLHRIEAACLPRNKRSIGLLEKCGFVREGHLRSYLKIAGRWEDHYLYSLLAEEWSSSQPRARMGAAVVQ